MKTNLRFTVILGAAALLAVTVNAQAANNEQASVSAQSESGILRSADNRSYFRADKKGVGSIVSKRPSADEAGRMSNDDSHFNWIPESWGQAY